MIRQQYYECFQIKEKKFYNLKVENYVQINCKFMNYVLKKIVKYFLILWRK